MSDDRRNLAEQVADLARRITGRTAPAPQHDVATAAAAIGRLDAARHLIVASMPTELPPGTGQLLADLRAKGTDATYHPVRPAAPDPLPAVEYTVEPTDDDRTYVPLHVREWARRVDALVADVKTTAPTDSPFGVVTATSSLRLALLGLRTATAQTQPHRDMITGVRTWPVEPDELVHLHALIGEVHDALAAMIAATQQQLVDAYRAAQRGTLHGPPGADPAVEVAAVMTMMLNVEHEATAGGRDCAIAAERLGRLVRPATPDQ